MKNNSRNTVKTPFSLLDSISYRFQNAFLDVEFLRKLARISESFRYSVAKTWCFSPSRRV
jgi:hypothetical protein